MNARPERPPATGHDGHDAQWNELATIHPPGWTYTVWRREIHWPLLATAIALTIVAVAVTATGSALELLPLPIVGAALGILAALWHWYLRLPLSGITAHRLPAATDLDAVPAAGQLIHPAHGEPGSVAALPTRRETSTELPAQRPVPALTTTTSAAALEAIPR